MRLFDSKGHLVQLGEKIGQGGEAVVHGVNGRADTVAKIYSKPSVERGRKLQAMVSLKTNELLKLSCWPTEILREQPNGRVSGFLMPKASGYKEVFKLYNPKSRQVEFQSVHWGFLIHAATNMARAFGSIHSAGYVIGDVNHSSVMIGPDAMVRLIDCDSFQVHYAGEDFPCEVAEPLHTAPELQGKFARSQLRTANHDNFGLAVLIFELLFMGRHPFAGNFEGGDLSLEEKIKTFRFAYGPNAKTRQMTQPPNTLPLSAVSVEVAQMFERAFSPEAAVSVRRPNAVEWVNALGRLQASLKQCARDKAHHYFNGLSACPWCGLEAQTGMPLFTIAFAPVHDSSGFNLALVWSQIAKVRCPEDVILPDPATFPKLKPSARYAAIRAKRITAYTVGAVLAASICLASLFFPDLVCGGVVVGIVVLSIFSSFASSIGAAAKREAAEKLNLASSNYQRLRNQWDSTADATIFKQRFQQLEAKKNQHQDLPAHRQREFQKLLGSLRDRQLYRYLDQHQIRPGKVNGVGAGRCATLSSYGIDTAADLNYQAIYRVPGFGDNLAWNLMAWRRELEGRFVFNETAGIDPRDRKQLETELANLQAGLEYELRLAAQELQNTAKRIESARLSLQAPLDAAMKELAQAEANNRI